MVTPGVEHISCASELSLPASRTTASQSNNKSYASNETGCLAEEHSRCLQMVTFGVKRISYEPELSLWALNTVASQSTTTGMSLTRRNYSPANVTLFLRSLVQLSFSCKCARSMCRVNLHHTFCHHITTSSLFRRLGLLDIGSYFYNRLLRWAGHVARMPMSRAPRQLLKSWVAHSRPVGCPQMTWGRTLENALKRKCISKEFDDWFAIAKDRSKWRQLTHSNPKPPDA